MPKAMAPTAAKKLTAKTGVGQASIQFSWGS
jgi:hypothetical protein